VLLSVSELSVISDAGHAINRANLVGNEPAGNRIAHPPLQQIDGSQQQADLAENAVLGGRVTRLTWRGRH
jgi:hypothetical protein